MCHSLYRLLCWLVLPLALLRLAVRGFKQRDYFFHWNERLSLATHRQADIWIHAVSLGESKLATRLAEEIQFQFRQKHPTGLRIIFSCTTPTGRRHLAGWIKNNPATQLAYKPFDCLLLQRRILNQVTPRIVVCIETELWPNLICECLVRGIATFVVNARLSRHSAKKQSRLLKLFRPLLRSTNLLVQDQASLRRFSVLAGKEPKAGLLTNCGNSKFDLQLQLNPDTQRLLAAATVPDEGGLRIICGSIRRDESEELMAQVAEFLTQFPQHRVIWVPRHPEKDGAFLSNQLKQKGLSWHWFRNVSKDANTKFTLVGGYGHLVDCYALADLVVLGGSFGHGGSHNLMEPGALGKAIIAGPSQHNFALAHSLFFKERAIVHLTSSIQLAAALERLAEDAQQRKQLGNNAARLVGLHRGATARQAREILLHL